MKFAKYCYSWENSKFRLIYISKKIEKVIHDQLQKVLLNVISLYLNTLIVHILRSINKADHRPAG